MVYETHFFPGGSGFCLQQSAGIWPERSYFYRPSRRRGSCAFFFTGYFMGPKRTKNISEKFLILCPLLTRPHSQMCVERGHVRQQCAILGTWRPWPRPCHYLRVCSACILWGCSVPYVMVCSSQAKICSWHFGSVAAVLLLLSQKSNSGINCLYVSLYQIYWI